MTTVYHTSYTEIPQPDVLHSRRFLDFGKGFYVTHLRKQAINYGNRFLKNNKPAVLNVYHLDFDPSAFRYKRFDSYNSEWLDFVINCRNGNEVENYDIIEGGIANDKVFTTIDLYFSGLIDKTEALNRLRYEKPNWQICLCTQNAIDKCLQFIDSEEIV